MQLLFILSSVEIRLYTCQCSSYAGRCYLFSLFHHRHVFFVTLSAPFVNMSHENCYVDCTVRHQHAVASELVPNPQKADTGLKTLGCKAASMRFSCKITQKLINSSDRASVVPLRSFSWALELSWYAYTFAS